MQYSRGKSALVFCSTRKGAQEAAQLLSQKAMTFGHSNPFIKNNEQLERLREASLSCSDKQMQSYILYGGTSLYFYYEVVAILRLFILSASQFTVYYRTKQISQLQLVITMAGFA